MTLRRLASGPPGFAARACGWVTLLALLPQTAAGATTHSTSAPIEETSEPNREEARGRFREGLALLDAGEYARALTCFEQAFEAWNNPKILLNIATAQRALGQLSKAANNYALYRRIAEPEPARAAEVDQILATLDAGLGRLILSHVDARQRFWLNDEELSVEPEQPIRIEPGEYTLRIVEPSGLADTRPMAIWPGELFRVDAARPRAPASSDSATSREEPESRRPGNPRLRVARVRVLARADVDVARRGALGAAGAAVLVTHFLRATGGALLGKYQGGWLGLEVVPSRQWLAPVVGLSAPFFFVDGLHAGMSAELGLRVELSPRVVPFARASVTHFPSAPADYVKTLFIPSVGVEVGL